MVRWEFIDLGELRPRNPVEKVNPDDTCKLVVLPGFEVSQTKQKPIGDIATWAYCFARYTAAMATKYPTCTVGFMAHQVTVVKAYTEAEDPAWRLYDEAYREKMAATGCREWKGMDVQLYQSVCAGRYRRVAIAKAQSWVDKPVTGTKRPRNEGGPGVCWQFNNGRCAYGQTCKFTHACGICRGPHPRVRCVAQDSGWKGGNPGPLYGQ
jgi:hypothetical protein